MRRTSATAIVTLVLLAAASPLCDGNSNGTAVPIRKHSSMLNADNTVDLEALDSHVVSIRAKIFDSFENYKRNTGMTHPASVKTRDSQKRTSPEGGAGLKSYINQRRPVFWYCTISIGTPPAYFTVQVDTGSSDLFIPGSDCGPSCRGHNLWNPVKGSSTAKAKNRRFYAKFADRSYTSGYLYADNVTVAGFTADAQTVGAARIYSSKFRKSNFPVDGVMGMAFQSLSSSGEYSIFETLVGENRMEPVFSFKLTSAGGELYLGGSNDKLYRGDIAYTRVTHKAHWEVNIQGIVGDGKTILANVDAIIDTGATLIAGDPVRVAMLHEDLGGKLLKGKPGLSGDFYTYPCVDFPSIGLTFGGRTFYISTLNLGSVSLGSYDCISGIFGVETDATYWIIGGLFLQDVYTIFDLGDSRVGFADLT